MTALKRPVHAAAMKKFSLTLIAAAIASQTAWAEQAEAPPAPPQSTDAAPRKETVTEELIRLLAKRNALSKEDAQQLIEHLRAEQTAAPAATQAASSPEAGGATAQAAADKSRVRVIYLPDSEKEKIREQIKQEVIATAKSENWALPNTFPEWTNRLTLDGDMRVRHESDFLEDDNAPAVNFQAINSGSPVNINDKTTPPPSLALTNTTRDRELARVRARIGLTAKVAEDLTAGFRFASGNTTNPVSTNQTLGNDFNKLTFVIDRAYIDYHPVSGFSFLAGRFPNPWQSTELVYDEDLNFDGFAGKFKQSVNENVTARATVGAFSVENTTFDFPSTNPQKGRSRDKWLFGAQFGADWKIKPDLVASGAVAYYYYYHLDGKAGSPCFAPTSSDSCFNDSSRPGFIQKGNTLFALRDLTPTLVTDTTAAFQYFGLVSPFRVLDVTGSLDWNLSGPLHLTLTGDYAHNLGFRSQTFGQRAFVNNFGNCPGIEDQSASAIACRADPPFAGSGARAYLAQASFGYPKVSERWQWSVTGGYRRLESDSVVDAFTDSDFHLGGTNAKGYYAYGSLGFTHNAWLTLRYLSATEINSSPLAIDVLQLDLNARF